MHKGMSTIDQLIICQHALNRYRELIDRLVADNKRLEKGMEQKFYTGALWAAAIGIVMWVITLVVIVI